MSNVSPTLYNAENIVICKIMVDIVLESRKMLELISLCMPGNAHNAVVVLRYTGNSPVSSRDLTGFMTKALEHRRFHVLDTDIPSDDYPVPEACENMTARVMSRKDALAVDLVSASRIARSPHFLCVMCCRVGNQGHQAKLCVWVRDADSEDC
jgi:hypothetical protein